MTTRLTIRHAIAAVALTATLLGGPWSIASADQPATKDDCKKGGWQTLTDAAGEPFKNQGDCVSFVASSKDAPSTNTAPVASDNFCPDPLACDMAGNLNDFAFDADGDTLTFELVALGDPADFFDFSLDEVTGEWSATCGATTQTGADSFTWRAFDGQAYSNIATQDVGCLV